MFESIRRNKIKTGFIVSLFLIMIALIMYFVCYYALGLGISAIVIAFVFSVISTWATYYNSDKIVLKMNHARPATKEENLKLVNILDSLVVASGLQHTPKLYVVDDSQPNAFATGRNPQNAVICVTSGLLNKLEYYELEGVVAHELGHIKNYDIRLSAVVTVMVGLVVILADFVTDILFWGGGRRDNDNKNPIILIAGLVCLILAPIFGQLMQLAISRKREFMADATAIEFTRNPDGLISALQKLDSDTNELNSANKSTAHMYIVSPFKENGKKKRKKSNLWSTHPSIEDRIDALRNLR